MTISIPNRLAECSLGQLCAYSDYASVMSVKGERSEAQSNRLLAAIMGVSGLSSTELGFASKKTLDAIVSSMWNGLNAIIVDIVNRRKSEIEPVKLFECLPEEAHIIESELIDIHWLRRKRTLKKYAPKTYEIVQNPDSLAGQIWLYVLDNVMKRKSKIPEDQPWLEWNLMTEVLACVAWRKDEAVLVKNEAGDMVVDMRRINKMSEVFKQLPATVGIDAYAFFLTTLETCTEADHSTKSTSQ